MIARVELQPMPEFDLTDSQREVLSKTLMWTKAFFDNVPAGTHIGGHGFDKTQRQAGMAAFIAHGEGYPIFLPVLVSMTMDIGRTSPDSRSKSWQHGLLSREIVTPFINQLEILTEAEEILVLDSIEDHPKKNENVRRNPIVEIAMDSDRLDCLGALGPLRSASWRPNIPLILPDETNTESSDTGIDTMWQDMAYRHMEWFDMLWTTAARVIVQPRVEAYKRYLEELRLEATFMYGAFRKLDL